MTYETASDGWQCCSRAFGCQEAAVLHLCQAHQRTRHGALTMVVTLRTTAHQQQAAQTARRHAVTRTHRHRVPLDLEGEAL